MEENTTTLSNDSTGDKLIALLEHPWQLIKEGSKYGVNGVKRFFAVLALFASTNTVLFVYSLIALIGAEFEMSKLLFTLLVLVFGLAITAFAAYRTYQYVVVETMGVVYSKLSGPVKQGCDAIIDKTESVFQSNSAASDSQLNKALDVGHIINEKFQKFPSFLRKGLMLVLNRVPIVGMLLDLKQDVVAGNKADASDKLYTNLDGFLTTNVFGANNTKWVWWMWPLNIILVVLWIRLKISG